MHGRTVVTVSSSSSFGGGGCWVGYTFHGAVIVHVFRVYSWGRGAFLHLSCSVALYSLLFFFKTFRLIRVGPIYVLVMIFKATNIANGR